MFVEDLRREYARARRRRNRWGAKVATATSSTVKTAVAPLDPTSGCLQARVDQINDILKKSQVWLIVASSCQRRSPPLAGVKCMQGTEAEREALIAERNGLVKSAVLERFGTQTGAAPSPFHSSATRAGAVCTVGSHAQV